MAPFGGKPTRRVDFTSERMSAMGRFFKNGTLEQEIVSAYGSPDMVVLALIERAHVEVGGLPSHLWALRVTLVYRKEERRGGWRTDTPILWWEESPWSRPPPWPVDERGHI